MLKTFFSVNKMEIEMKTVMPKCMDNFINCSKEEDLAVEYMVQCYTSQSQIKANIKELMIIKDAANKLYQNQQAIVSTSQKNLNKQLGSKRVSCNEASQVSSISL